MSVFVLEKISKSYVVNKKENKVLNNISIKFPNTGLFSIVGKSGCGKSTLLNILMGIEKPTSGKVYFEGTDISKFNDRKFSKYHLQGVSLIFQHYNLFSELTSIENVILPLLMAGINKVKAINKAKQLFEQLGIQDLEDRKVKNLSGGEKQRVAILRSLITDPKAILCDEPTGALDGQNSREIMGILSKISREKLVIMVSHNKNLVNEYSDYILTLKNGQIVNKNNIKIKKDTNNNSPVKISYSNKWSNKFLKINLKRNLKKDIFSSLACILSFSAMFLAVGFSEGSKSSQEMALKQSLSLCFATASESQFIDIEGSPLSFEKTVRPSPELVDEYFSDFDSIRYEENVSYFISNYPSCYFNDNKLTNFEMIPLYDFSLDTFGKELLCEGNGSEENFDSIIINEDFAKLLGNDLIGKTVILSNEAPVNYVTGNIDNPIIKEKLNFNKQFIIKGIVKEFEFLNSPKIYYSYKGARNYLKNEYMEQVSEFLGKRYTFLDYLENCKEDDPVCSYSSYLFVTNPNDINRFFNKVGELKNEPLQISSKALEVKNTYSTFISSFSSTLIIFVIIAFLGINFILGMISLSTFLENRKNTAILTCLGAKNYSIYSIHLSENYLVIIFSFILSIFLSIFLQSKFNNILVKSFAFDNLINIPFLSYAGISFGLPILICLIALVCSTLFTLVPMIIYRHNSLSNELRDE